MIGIGDKQYRFAVYIGNRPPLDKYLKRSTLVPAKPGEIATIASETGNHWRKIFNLYAKLGYMLDTQNYVSWQAYRDDYLLSDNSGQALLFDKHIVIEEKGIICLICGKSHAEVLLQDNPVVRMGMQKADDDFSINTQTRTIITPYFDYRQLSNVKLQTLVDYIQRF